ncbi:MAG TPA: STAS domain-containing protein [Candidatus Acidoferrales bacterium]|nr:STAS domain-containing protein [Candidatus Acidoferrales bacterium]
MGATPSPASSELTLRIDKDPDGATVHCAGKITATSTGLLQDQVRPYIPNSKRVVLDLSQVNYLDSSGLGAVVRLWMTAKKANCDFKVANLTPRIKDLFSLTNLSSIFENVEHSGM